MQSAIKGIYRSKKNDGTFYGFIAASDGSKDYYFTSDDLLTDQTVESGIDVEFEPVIKGDKRFARNVRVRVSNADDSKSREINNSNNGKVSENQPNFKIESVRDLSTKVVAQMEALDSVTDPELFEDGVFLLLRLLGIHTAYQYPRSAQAGEADGFFMIESLTVMYDCTLHSNFEEFKQTQIENYINQLSQKTQLSFKYRKADGSVSTKKIPLSHSGKKHVWIVTQGTTRELQDYGGIKVKEISVYDICKVLKRRIYDIAYDSDRLVTDLILIGNA